MKIITLGNFTTMLNLTPPAMTSPAQAVHQGSTAE